MMLGVMEMFCVLTVVVRKQTYMLPNCIKVNTYTHAFTEQKLNKISGLYKRLHPGCGIVLLFCTILSFRETALRVHRIGASLVAQWLRIRLPMQWTQVQALVQEDPTCCRATKPVCHNY